MADTKKTKNIKINVKQESFVSRLIGSEQTDDFSGIALLRNTLSNEKAKILYALKSEKPKSIYDLAKKLGRDFKSVRDDLKALEKFGIVSFTATKTGKRKALTPELTADSFQITIAI